MTLAEKTKFGPYEIVMPIGAGGMGEVYRARDTRLGRDVALKVLPEEFAHDAERMAQLRREAQVLASLNHPNIAAIYGFEDSGSTHALVMELVEGPTLAERIKQGAIPIDEALLIAKQICEGLEYAHERGIIHRDLKPSNVKVTPDGAVKILDFGLAKAIEGDPSTTSVENSPTLSAMATHAGFLLGTAAYMSPEQARGKKTDRRADIWAFGVVLFEMLSGERLFSGETTSDTLAAVIRAEPDWNELPAQTPPRIRELLHRCLKKDPRQRLQSIGDARVAIDEILSGAPEAALLTGARELTSRNKWLRVLPWALVGMLTVALAASFLIFPLAMREPPASVVVSEISAPASTNFVLSGDVSGPPVLSPDGQQLAFTAMGSDDKQQLWVRPLNSATAQALAETDGATYPFWSPDSRSLGYFANGKLNRIDTSGGAAIALADAGNGRGGSWGADGTILFTPDAATPIHRMPASGGTAQLVTKVNASRQEISHRWPQFLPDGKHFLFYARGTDPQSNATYVASVDGGEQKLILRGDSSAVYAAPGYLLFIRQGTLMAQRFDTRELQLAGDAMPLAEHADTNDRVWRGVFTVSENGILAYGVGSSVGANSRLLWFDRSGKQTGETGTPAEYNNPKLSPDGHELAVAMNVAQRTNIWVCDLARGIPTRLTFSSAIDVEPSWSPDGKTIAFMSNRNGQFHLYQKAADGTGSTTPLAVDDGNKYVPDWSSDGRYVLYQRLTAQPGSRLEIWALPLFGDRKAFPVVQNQQFNQTQAALAANGKWLAYMSVETGRPEIYVVPFLRRGGKWEVSTSGGLWPRWRRDGKELFYMSLDYKIVSAEISEVGTSLVIGKVTPLFQTNVWSGPGWSYDVSADGKKFVVVSQVAQQAAGPLTLVTNWPALLKKQQ